MIGSVGLHQHRREGLDADRELGFSYCKHIDGSCKRYDGELMDEEVYLLCRSCTDQ